MVLLGEEMDQIYKQVQNAQQERREMSNSGNTLSKLENLSKRINKLEAFTKKIFREQIKDQEEIDSEAKNRIAHIIETALSRFNPEYDEPDDEPDELDGSDPRDRKIIEHMTNLATDYLDTIVEYEESDESSDESSEQSTDDEEMEEEEMEEGEEGSEEGSSVGSGEES